MAPLAAASLHGWVNLTNISSMACTLEGVPAVSLTSHGIPVNVSYGQSSSNGAAKVGLPPHGTANFPITWSAPYCPGENGPIPGPHSMLSLQPEWHPKSGADYKLKDFVNYALGN